MATTTTSSHITPPLQAAQVLADLSALFIAEPASALHMMSCYVPIPETRDLHASRILSIPDAPNIARAKAIIRRSSSSPSTPALSPTTTTKSPPANASGSVSDSASPKSARAAETTRPPASPAAAAKPSSFYGRGAKARAVALLEGEGDGEDADMWRARMLLRCFDARRKLAGVGGGAETLEGARRTVEGVRVRLVGRESGVRFG